MRRRIDAHTDLAPYLALEMFGGYLHIPFGGGGKMRLTRWVLGGFWFWSKELLVTADSPPWDLRSGGGRARTERTAL